MGVIDNMVDPPQNKRAEPQKFKPLGIESMEAFGTPQMYWDYGFAPYWFRDARQEAEKFRDSPEAEMDQVRHAKCREIIFAVCFAESYLFEWVRDEVLKKKFDGLNEYFRPPLWDPDKNKWKFFHKPLKKKWMKVPKKAFRKKGIPENFPDTNQDYWKAFELLWKHRNGLSHAGASRPETIRPMEEGGENPSPSITELDALKPGWAVGVVAGLVKELHCRYGSQPPEYLLEA